MSIFEFDFLKQRGDGGNKCVVNNIDNEVVEFFFMSRKSSNIFSELTPTGRAECNDLQKLIWKLRTRNCDLRNLFCVVSLFFAYLS